MTAVFSTFSCIGLLAVSICFGLERWTYSRHKGRKWFSDVLNDARKQICSHPLFRWLNITSTIFPLYKRPDSTGAPVLLLPIFTHLDQMDPPVDVGPSAPAPQFDAVQYHVDSDDDTSPEVPHGKQRFANVGWTVVAQIHQSTLKQKTVSSLAPGISLGNIPPVIGRGDPPQVTLVPEVSNPSGMAKLVKQMGVVQTVVAHSALVSQTSSILAEREDLGYRGVNLSVYYVTLITVANASIVGIRMLSFSAWRRVLLANVQSSPNGSSCMGGDDASSVTVSPRSICECTYSSIYRSPNGDRLLARMSRGIKTWTVVRVSFIFDTSTVDLDELLLPGWRI